MLFVVPRLGVSKPRAAGLCEIQFLAPPVGQHEILRAFFCLGGSGAWRVGFLVLLQVVCVLSTLGNDQRARDWSEGIGRGGRKTERDKDPA